MNHYYRLLVPTTMYNRPASADLVMAIRIEVKKAFASAFGGYTETAASGGYLADSGDLIEEPVFAIEASYEAADDKLVWRLAERIKTALSQECVMIRKDHEVHFV